MKTEDYYKVGDSGTINSCVYSKLCGMLLNSRGPDNVSQFSSSFIAASFLIMRLIGCND